MFWNQSTTINEKKWERYIDRPAWYLKLLPDYKRLNKRAEKNPELKTRLKEQAYAFFERHLETEDLQLGNLGPNWDEERKQIDAIVIHHTANLPGMTLERLSAMHLLRLYASHYIYPPKEEKQIKGQPIWSGHFHNGKQVFYSYHWLVRENGTIERLLADNEIGWQSGNWDVNTRSIAICLDGDYRQHDPSERMLGAVAELIRSSYGVVPKEHIFGHEEINKKTDCPGMNFLNGWKEKITRRGV